MPRLRLIRATAEHQDVLLPMALDFRAAGDERFAAVIDDPEAFWSRMQRFAEGRDLPDDRVQQTLFLGLAGGVAVGAIRLRHRLILVLELDGGHIGYEVRPSERRKGYATELLRLALPEARAIGIERALLTVALDNAASIRVIEKNGGVRDPRQTIDPASGRTNLRYWIDTGAAA